MGGAGVGDFISEESEILFLRSRKKIIEESESDFLWRRSRESESVKIAGVTPESVRLLNRLRNPD